jgi:hypothetical protein
MPQLLMLAALGAGVYLGAKWLGRKVEAAMPRQRGAQADATEPTTRKPSRDDIPTLVQDPETGVYKIDGQS